MIQAVVVTACARLGSRNWTCCGHCIDIQSKNAGIGGDIALVGGDATIAAPVINAVGRLAKTQQAGLLLEG